MKRLLRILLVMLLLLPAPAAVEAATPKSKTKTTQTQSKQTKQKPKAKKTGAAKQKSQATPKPKNSAEAKRQRKQTERQIAKTSKELKAAEAELTRNLRKVNRLEDDIKRSSAASAQLKARIDSLKARAGEMKDSIKVGEAELERLRGLYSRAVRSSRKNRREMNTLTFVFSAETFRQAWRRMRYLNEFSQWRQRKTDEIRVLVDDLHRRQGELDDVMVKLQNLRRESMAEERRLRSDHASLETAVGSLRGKQKELNTMLSRQKSTLEKLDREIERLIQKEIEEQRRREAEEARRKAEEERRKAQQGSQPAQPSQPEAPAKPAERPATDFKPGATAANSPGNFASQRGKLPSPLSHTFVVVQGFGVTRHRSIKTLEVNNPGVDLETSLSATARAVYPGVVSAVFMQEGLGHVVLVRHGEYLTVYANIKSLNVKKGQKLKTGDVIGSVGPSDSANGRGQLHFEIRREREKFNPMQWLKR